jgi:allantoinase
LVHCEISEEDRGIDELRKNPGSYRAYLNSRPKEWENHAIREMINLCRETKAKVHIVHLSSAEALPMIKKAKEEGLPLTVETAPHYLCFSSEEIEDGKTVYKCAPPIREKENNEKLWEALNSGLIDFIATDHSPAPPAMKEIASGNFEKAWGGIAGLQFSFPAIWNEAFHRKIPLSKIIEWMCENPARFLELQNSKGFIKEGYDSDLVILDPDKEILIDEENIFHRHKATPYAGRILRGEILQTIINGKIVYDRNKFLNLHEGKVLMQKSVNIS